MAPHAIYEPVSDNKIDITDLKVKVVSNHVELDATPKPPVADDFMYDFKYNHVLPTADLLGIEIPRDCDAQREAENILAHLSDVIGRGDARAFADMFLEYGRNSIRRIRLITTD